MASPARLHNSLFVFLAILVGACAYEAPVVLHEGDPDLKTLNGKLFWKGELFTGSTLAMFDSDTARFSSYRNGVLHGVGKEWFENGVLKSKRLYHAGKKVGIHFGWYEDGSQRFLYHFENDVYHGVVKEWQPDGQLYREFNYVDGQESGRQRMWEADGRLKANYEVRNGRKYGLAGSKNCVSTL